MEIIGRKVFHKEYGIGTIIECESKIILKHIKVEFKDKTLLFLYPSCMLFSLSWYNEDNDKLTESIQSLSCKDNPSIPHKTITYKENVVPATCKNEGSYDEVVRCSVCDKEISRRIKTIEKKPHTVGEPISKHIIESTCESEGSYDKVDFCSVCYTVLNSQKVITPKLGHDFRIRRENEIPITCHSPGSYEEVTYCTRCKK